MTGQHSAELIAIQPFRRAGNGGARMFCGDWREGSLGEAWGLTFGVCTNSRKLVMLKTQPLFTGAKSNLSDRVLGKVARIALLLYQTKWIMPDSGIMSSKLCVPGGGTRTCPKVTGATTNKWQGHNSDLGWFIGWRDEKWSFSTHLAQTMSYSGHNPDRRVSNTEMESSATEKLRALWTLRMQVCFPRQ